MMVPVSALVHFVVFHHLCCSVICVLWKSRQAMPVWGNYMGISYMTSVISEMNCCCSGRYYYWNTETDEVSWLSPDHPRAVITLSADRLKGFCHC